MDLISVLPDAVQSLKASSHRNAPDKLGEEKSGEFLRIKQLVKTELQKIKDNNGEDNAALAMAGYSPSMTPASASSTEQISNGQASNDVLSFFASMENRNDAVSAILDQLGIIEIMQNSGFIENESAQALSDVIPADESIMADLSKLQNNGNNSLPIMLEADSDKIEDEQNNDSAIIEEVDMESFKKHLNSKRIDDSGKEKTTVLDSLSGEIKDTDKLAEIINKNNKALNPHIDEIEEKHIHSSFTLKDSEETQIDETDVIHQKVNDKGLAENSRPILHHKTILNAVELEAGVNTNSSPLQRMERIIRKAGLNDLEKNTINLSHINSSSVDNSQQLPDFNTIMPEKVSLDKFADFFADKVHEIFSESTDGKKVFSLEISPPHLGEVKITVEMNNNILHAGFLCSSETGRTISEYIPQLEETLSHCGIQLGSSNVETGSKGAGGDDRKPQSYAASVNADEYLVDTKYSRLEHTFFNRLI